MTTLLEVARDRPPVLAPVAIDQLLDEVLDLLAWFRVDVAIERDAEGCRRSNRDPSRLRQLLAVLLVDALRGARRATARRLGADRRVAGHGPGRRGAGGVDLSPGGRCAARIDETASLAERMSLARWRRGPGGSAAGGESRTGAGYSARLADRGDGDRPRQARPALTAGAPPSHGRTILVCDDEDSSARCSSGPRARRDAVSTRRTGPRGALEIVDGRPR